VSSTTGTGSAKILVRVVMFVDISGSSWLYKELGDQAAVRRVRSCLSQLARVVDENGGRTIKNIGDGLMCDFAFADQALQAAEAMHLAVADEERGAQPNLDIHIGCHLGHVIESGGDVFGDTVNIAARVTGVARTGQILTTQPTVDALSPALQLNARPLDRVSVKGQSDTVALFDYLWRRRGDDLTVIGTRPAQVDQARLRIARGGDVVWLDRKGTGSILLGRDRGCGLAVPDPAASRHHATIEVRGDRFVLVDHSANGTYVASGTTETCLKREEIILPAYGRLGLGASTSAEGVTVLEFSRVN
jgi:class 3 adenylate cyclase